MHGYMAVVVCTTAYGWARMVSNVPEITHCLVTQKFRLDIILPSTTVRAGWWCISQEWSAANNHTIEIILNTSTSTSTSTFKAKQVSKSYQPSIYCNAASIMHVLMCCMIVLLRHYSITLATASISYTSIIHHALLNTALAIVIVGYSRSIPCTSALVGRVILWAIPWHALL